MLGEHAWEEILREIRSVSHDLLLLLEEMYDATEGQERPVCGHSDGTSDHPTVPGVDHESTTHTH